MEDRVEGFGAIPAARATARPALAEPSVAEQERISWAPRTIPLRRAAPPTVGGRESEPSRRLHEQSEHGIAPTSNHNVGGRSQSALPLSLR